MGSTKLSEDSYQSARRVSNLVRSRIVLNSEVCQIFAFFITSGWSVIRPVVDVLAYQPSRIAPIPSTLTAKRAIAPNRSAPRPGQGDWPIEATVAIRSASPANRDKPISVSRIESGDTQQSGNVRK